MEGGRREGLDGPETSKGSRHILLTTRNKLPTAGNIGFTRYVRE